MDWGLRYWLALDPGFAHASLPQVRQLPEPSFDNEPSALTDAPPGHLEGCAAHLMVGEPLTENADTKIGRPSAAEKVRMFARCI